MTLPEPLMTQTVVLLYLVAAAIFAGAAVKGWRNYQRTKGISNYWLIFAIAVGLSASFSAMNALEYAGIAVDIIDQLDIFIGYMFIFALIMTAIETLTSNIQVTIE